jgi:hypothetical protein
MRVFLLSVGIIILADDKFSFDGHLEAQLGATLPWDRR